MKWLGWFLIVFGVLLVIGSVSPDDGKDQARPPGERAVVGVVAVVMVLGGALIIRREGERQRSLEQQAKSTLIINLAKQSGGRVTVNEIAANGHVSLDDARRELERMVQMGSCQKEIGTGGMEVYYFPEFESKANKQDLFTQR